MHLAYIAQYSNQMHEKLYGAHTVTNVHNIYDIAMYKFLT